MINFSLMKPISTASATMTTSTGSPRRSRLGIEVSPVPMDVAAVTSFFFVRSSSRGISSRYAAVKAPEVMTRMSFDVFMVILFPSAVLLSLKPASRKVFKIRVKQQDSGLDYSQNNARGANLSCGGQWVCALNKHRSVSAGKLRYEGTGSKAPLKSACCTLCARFLRGSLLGLQCVATLSTMRELSGLVFHPKIQI